jgi:hypothetical protein
MENMKMKIKWDKKNLTFPEKDLNFEPQVFEQVPAQNLNFEGD